jgi:hypothetical protein
MNVNIFHIFGGNMNMLISRGAYLGLVSLVNRLQCIFDGHTFEVTSGDGGIAQLEPELNSLDRRLSQELVQNCGVLHIIRNR